MEQVLLWWIIHVGVHPTYRGNQNIVRVALLMPFINKCLFRMYKGEHLVSYMLKNQNV